MQTITLGQNTGNTVFSGLFGATGQGQADIFSMLLAMLNPAASSGDAAATSLLGGQNLPSSNSLFSSGLLQGLMPDQTMPEGTDPSSQLAAILASLQNQPEMISPELKALLGDGPVDLEAIRLRLKELPEDQQQQIMGELAALLAPAPVMPQPEIATANEADLVTGLQSADDASADALPVDVPEKNAQLQVAAGTDTASQTGLDTAQANADETSKPQAKSISAQDSAPLPAEQRPQQTTQQAAQAIEKTEQASALSPQESATESAATPASALAAAAGEAKVAQRDEAKAGKRREIKLGDSAQARSQGVEISPLQAAPKPDASSIAEKADAKPVTQTKTVSSSNDNAANLMREMGQSTTQTRTETSAQAIQDPAKPQQASFADHLQNVKLNRTGAHVPVSEQVAVQMSKSVRDGQERFTIKLSPADLGRIEVRVDMGADGKVTASFHVDQPATLDLLQRDQRGLERALSDAGIKTDGSTLNFNLRGDGQQHRQPGADAQANGNGGNNGRPLFGGEAEMADEAPLAGIMEMSWFVGNDRLDVRV